MRSRFCVAAGCFLLAMIRVPAAIAAAAQEDIDQGLAAVARRDYDGAERNFDDASRKAPPGEVCRAIGEAEAKIPGRELRAAYWLLGYLGQKPAPADAAEVRRTVNALAAASRERIVRLLEQQEDEIRQMANGDPRDEEWRTVAGSWETLGDFAKAQQAIDLIQSAPPRSDALITLARAQADAAGKKAAEGDWTGAAAMLVAAKKSTDTSPFTHAQGEGLYAIVVAHVTFAQVRISHGELELARKEVEEAQHFADGTDDWSSESEQLIATTLLSLGKAQARAGDTASAHATLQLAAKTAALVTKSGAWRYDVLMDLADSWTRIGDPAEARPVLQQALALVTVYNDPDDERMQVACAQARAGDEEGVAKTLTEIRDSRIKDRTRRAIEQIRKPGPRMGPIEEPPLASDDPGLGTPQRLEPEMVFWNFREGWDKPWFTAYADFSNYLAMGEEIEKTPVQNGQQPAYRPGDRPYALHMVVNSFVWAQQSVDSALKPGP